MWTITLVAPTGQILCKTYSTFSDASDAFRRASAHAGCSVYWDEITETGTNPVAWRES